MKNKINILILSGFCILLLISRAIYLDNFHFKYLIWNLFLAYIPFVISEAIIKKENRKISIFVLCILPIVIIFLPNSIYLITDLIHLRKREPIPLWFDAIIFFSYGLLGLLLSTQSLMNIENLLSDYLSPKKRYISIIIIIVLIGLGVYLGRFERWNSWDIVSNPIDLIYHTIQSLFQIKTWIIIGIFSGLQFVFWQILNSSTKSNLS